MHLNLKYFRIIQFNTCYAYIHYISINAFYNVSFLRISAKKQIKKTKSLFKPAFNNMFSYKEFHLSCNAHYIQDFRNA